MHSLLLPMPVAFTIGLTILLSVVILSIVKRLKRTNQQHSIEWLKLHGKRVVATVIQVASEGEWQYGSKRNRWNAWEGRYELERSWQTAHFVIAQWHDPQTSKTYTFRARIDAPADTRKYAQGYPLPVFFNPGHPEQCYVELQSAAGLRV